MSKTQSNPKVSVLMPNYNGEAYLREAVESVLNQTYRDFIFIIVDDGSTDSSKEVIESYDDPRINLIINGQNKGLSYTRNLLLDNATGEYIVFIDSDDVCLPQRIQKQVKFMDENPEIGVCGSTMQYIEGETLTGKVNAFPSDPEILKALTLFEIPLFQGSAILRTAVISQNNLRFDSQYAKIGEDYHMWCRLTDFTRLSNLQEALTLRRVHPRQVTAGKNELKQFPSSIRRLQLNKVGIAPTEEEMKLHDSIANREFEFSKNYYRAVNEWFDKIIRSNREAGYYYKEKALNKILASYWLKILKNSMPAVYYFMTAPMSSESKINTTFSKAKGIIKRYFKER